jgi:mRNA-degrading endonuclease toxin of MazEF toxin-antitoxin module
MLPIEQGDILSIERVKGPVLVVSKNFFNTAEMAIVCPIVKNAIADPLHIEISTKEVSGYVLCEEMKLMDFCVRGFKHVSRISYEDIINITDAIQGIFDY